MTATEQRMCKTKTRSIDEWATVAVTALPAGWVNVYDDKGVEITSPCPALLLQENRSTHRVRYDVRDDGTLEYRNETTVNHDPPYDTRVVYADDEGGGVLTEANDAGNYVRTEYQP